MPKMKLNSGFIDLLITDDINAKMTADIKSQKAVKLLPDILLQVLINCKIPTHIQHTIYSRNWQINSFQLIV